ncbi:hypothetical protein WOLCODRAFT_19579 [Wolfiporia cocos MD-104 SS10]|uniref:Uncharacterized protein n=1 Tax=Wolfiporia cocos (strain MD-104) TaxID=742152 RepID=A0A2H3JDK8_WOLCO|nr:hypothetical protein WOLCODRAFT_19579 [Wolfiporia cocos MD-104 SS10]
MSSPYIFHKADDDRTYTRKMYGFESLAACFAEAGSFFYHEIWVDSTLVEHRDEKTIIDRNTELTRRLWPVSAGRHMMEFHYGPESLQQGIWIFAIHGPHFGCDARIANDLLDQFLRCLWDELLNAGSTSVSTLRWGQETSRLASAAAVLTGDFDSILSMNAELQASPAPTSIPFLPPVFCDPTVQGVSITHRVLFDEDKTRAFRTLCRKHSRTVTQVIDSLYAVAHVETTLRNARARGADRFQTVMGLYKTSDIWLMPWSIRDQVT